MILPQESQCLPVNSVCVCMYVCKLLSSSISLLVLPYTWQLEILVAALFRTRAVYSFSFGGDFCVSGM